MTLFYYTSTLYNTNQLVIKKSILYLNISLPLVQLTKGQMKSVFHIFFKNGQKILKERINCEDF